MNRRMEVIIEEKRKISTLIRDWVGKGSSYGQNWTGQAESKELSSLHQEADGSEYPEEGGHWWEVRQGELRHCCKEVEISGAERDRPGLQIIPDTLVCAYKKTVEKSKHTFS